MDTSNEQCQKKAAESESHQVDILKAYQHSTEQHSQTKSNSDSQSEKMAQITDYLRKKQKFCRIPQDKKSAALHN